MNRAEVQTIPAYHQILNTLFQEKHARSEGQLVAVTAANSGEGVSYIVDSLATQLAAHPINSVAVIDTRVLPCYASSPEALIESFTPREDRNYVALKAVDDDAVSATAMSLWTANKGFRTQCMQGLRGRFNYVLLDCPPPRFSGEVLSLAPLVDGLVLVAEANKTKKEHLKNLERTIESAHGRITGYVLNKREYVIPHWLYSRL